jgi:hypothetical protein
MLGGVLILPGIAAADMAAFQATRRCAQRPWRFNAKAGCHPAAGNLPALLEDQLVHITPDPIFAPLHRLDYGVFGSVKMLGGMLILRGIAAADVAAFQADPQMDPAVAHFHTLLAAFRPRLGSRTLLQMLTSLHVPPDSQYTGVETPRRLRQA